MLGKQVGEVQGQQTGLRVLPNSDGRPTVEVSFQGAGHFYDVSITDMGTYNSVMRPDGTLYGEGQGIIMSAEGALTWLGTGLGHLTGSGGTTYRGSVYYETASPKFADAAKVAYVYEYEVDEGGKYSAKLYEWK